MAPSLGAVSSWAHGADYEPVAIGTFLEGADYYLIAHAHAHDHVVVTHERFSDSSKRIKIPNVCLALEIKHVSPYEMLRSERARFVLSATA